MGGFGKAAGVVENKFYILKFFLVLMAKELQLGLVWRRIAQFLYLTLLLFKCLLNLRNRD